jgi:hypothetical protein
MRIQILVLVLVQSLVDLRLKVLAGDGKAEYLLICINGSNHPMNLCVREMEMSITSDTKDPVKAAPYATLSIAAFCQRLWVLS